MGDTVWISIAPGSGEHMMRKLTYNFGERATIDQAMTWAQENMSGQSLDSTCFPPEFHGTRNANKAGYKRLPDLFNASDFWAVSAATANIMREFDLGDGGLYPVRVLNRDRDAVVPGEWFCINFGNRKSAFVLEQSSSVRDRYIRPKEKGWFPKATIKDDDIAVSSRACAGPDIWVDPQVGAAFFLSGTLGNALRKAKADKGFFLHKCRIV